MQTISVNKLFRFKSILLLSLLCCNQLFSQSSPQSNLYRVDFGVTYRLTSVANGKDVEVEDGLINKGERIQQFRGYTRNGIVDGHNQEWIFLPAGYVTRADGSRTYLVRILNNGFLHYMSARSGTAPRLEKVNPATSNMGLFWEVLRNAQTGSVRLKAHTSNLFLQVPANSNDGESLLLAPESGQPNQEFRMITFSGYGPPGSLNNIPLVLKPASNTSMALDVTACNPAENTILQLWNKGSNNLCQQFTMRMIPDAGNVFSFTPGIAGSSFIRLQDVNSTMPGANIVIGSPVSGIATYWFVIQVMREPGKYVLINHVSGMCMEVWNNRTDAGATIGQNIFTNGNNQKWVIQRAD